MKRFLIVLLFLILPFSIPVSTFAQNPTPTSTCRFQKYTNHDIFSQIWAWITNLFAKPHVIDTNRPQNIKSQDLSDYGIANTPDYKAQHSFAGSRSTSSNTQDCLKGKIIEDALAGISNDFIGTICTTSDNQTETCSDKKISDLAHYLFQTNQQFLCDTNDKKIDTPQNIIDKINSLFSNQIPSSETPCYGGIYDDFYLTPISNTANDEKNTVKIMDQPIPLKNQTEVKTVQSQEAIINNLFSPQSEIDKGTASGLSGLVPESEK